jgi:hypothetical protein
MKSLVKLYNSKKFWGFIMFSCVLALAYCLLMQDFIKKGYDKDFPIPIQNQLKENARIAGLTEVGYWCFSIIATANYLFLITSNEKLYG